MRYIDWIAFKYRMRNDYAPVFLDFNLEVFHFGSYADIDAVPTIPISLEGNSYFESILGADAIQTMAASFQQLEYFDSALLVNVLDTVSIVFNNFEHFASNVGVNVYDNKAVEVINPIHFNPEFSLIVFDLAELMFSPPIHFTYNEMALEHVEYHDVSIENSVGYVMTAESTVLDIYEISLTYTDIFASSLEIVPIYIYMLEFENIALRMESGLSLEHVEYVYVPQISEESYHIESSLLLDATELVNTLYVLENHFVSTLDANTATTISAELQAETHTSQEAGAELVTDFSALSLESEISHFSSSVLLEYFIPTYLEFESRIFGSEGTISSMFLKRDRYLNDEEFFDLSISSFEELSIEDLLEVEI